MPSRFKVKRVCRRLGRREQDNGLPDHFEYAGTICRVDRYLELRCPANLEASLTSQLDDCRYYGWFSDHCNCFGDCQNCSGAFLCQPGLFICMPILSCEGYAQRFTFLLVTFGRRIGNQHNASADLGETELSDRYEDSVVCELVRR